MDKNKLTLQRLAGGSIIDNPPLFSDDGLMLFILRENATQALSAAPEEKTNTVHVYSTKTGGWLRDLETCKRIVNIQNSPDEPNVLFGCTTSGVIVKWNVKNGGITKAIELTFPEKNATVETFHVVPYENYTRGLITWTCGRGSVVQMGIFDLHVGYQQQSDILRLGSGDHMVSVSRSKHNIVAAIQNCTLFVGSYRKGNKMTNSWLNAGKQRFTTVACHPVDCTVAVGDRTGKIFIYYNLFAQTKAPTNELFHWHHNPVKTVAFTSSGSMFYSGGGERVLLGWNYNKREHETRPRLNGTICHIAVSSDNQKIAVSTGDNGILLVNPQLKDLCVIQNFVRGMAEGSTPWPKLPLGLKVDPRTGYLVLNGRIGQLQFYSPYDERFFNLDTSMDNQLSLECGKILYNTRLTHVACNVDWLVTAECLDDLKHIPEIRLKFWLFDSMKKTYILNTQIETPHEGGVTALEFSSATHADNLLCATSGLDGKVRVWCLEESQLIAASSPLDKLDGEPQMVTKKYWICLSTTSYKSLPVNSLAFSSDGSLLAVGFANTLCIYIPKTLRIKAVLSTPSGQDGSTNKLIVNKSKVLSDITGKEYEQIKQMVKAFLENDDDKLLNELKDKVNKSPEMGQKKRTIELAFSDLAVEDKENIFAEIQKLNELNFFQKLEIFQKIGIHIRLPADLKEKFLEYVHNYMRVRDKEINLEERLSGLAPDKQFVAHLKLQNYLSRRSDAAANGLHMKNVTFYDDDDVAIVSSRRKNRDKAMEVDEKQKPVANPIRKVAKIKHILFAAGDCSHLVIVCTENRLLIWNLLTLRLHASFKLTVRHIAVDPRTNLVAAFTFFDELYVFEPSKPYLLDTVRNMPKIVGLVWYPKQEPRQQSLDIDWQSISQLIFLTPEQELVYLCDNNFSLMPEGASLKEMDELVPQTKFGAMFAKQITNDTVASTGPRNFAGALLGEPTKNCVKSLTNLQTHTMAPVSFLSYGFLTKLLSNEIEKSKATSQSQGLNDENSISDPDDSDSEIADEINAKIMARKDWSRLENKVDKTTDNDKEKTNTKLNKLRKEKINLKF